MTDEINAISRTQTIVVEPSSRSASIINAGPQGVAGPPGLTGPMDAEALPGQLKADSLIEVRDYTGTKRFYVFPQSTGDIDVSVDLFGTDVETIYLSTKASEHRTTMGACGNYGQGASLGYVEINSSPDSHGGSYILAVAHENQINPMFVLKDEINESILLFYQPNPLLHAGASSFNFGKHSVLEDPFIGLLTADSSTAWSYCNFYVGYENSFENGFNAYVDQLVSEITIGLRTDTTKPGIDHEGVTIRKDSLKCSVDIFAVPTQTSPLFSLRNASGASIFSISPNGSLVANGLPTSNPGGTGRVWNDAGTLKIT